MARPAGVYVVFLEGRVARVVESYREARALSPHRAYKRFGPGRRTEAEEFAAWWSKDHPSYLDLLSTKARNDA